MIFLIMNWLAHQHSGVSLLHTSYLILHNYFVSLRSLKSKYAARTTYTVRISETGLTKFGDQLPCEDVRECGPSAYMVGDIKQLHIDGCASLKGVIVIEENRGALTVLEINNCPALQVLNCYGNQLTAPALNAMFTALPDRTGGKRGSAFVFDNPGSADCDKSIVEDKNWGIY
jgi:hypothetical protein